MSHFSQLRDECYQMAIDMFEELIKNDGKPPNQQVYTKEDFTLTKENEYEKICETLRDNAHFPTIHCYTLLRRKCQKELEAEKYKEASLTMLQSQGITFHHQALQQYQRRLSKVREKNKADKNAKTKIERDEVEDLFADDSSSDDDDTPKWRHKGESFDRMLNRILAFQTPSETAEKFSSYLKHLPKGWRVVQISAELPSKNANPFKSYPKDQANDDENLALVIVTLDCCGKEIDENNISLHKIPAIQRGENPTILKEFQDIMAMHKRIYSVDVKFSKQEHNKNRDELDNRLESIMDTMENKWLSYAKCLLFGRPCNEKKMEEVNQAVISLTSRFFKHDAMFASSGRKLLLSRCLEAIDKLNSTQLHKCLLHCLNGVEDNLSELIDEVRNLFPFAKDDIFSQKPDEPRHPVILILDKEIQCLPWESLRLVSVFSTSMESHPPPRFYAPPKLNSNSVKFKYIFTF